MKKHQFMVELEFEDKISGDDEIKEIMQNILESLKHCCDTAGLAPEDSETFTTKITVSNSIINEKVEDSLVTFASSVDPFSS